MYSSTMLHFVQYKDFPYKNGPVRLIRSLEPELTQYQKDLMQKGSPYDVEIVFTLNRCTEYDYDRLKDLLKPFYLRKKWYAGSRTMTKLIARLKKLSNPMSERVVYETTKSIQSYYVAKKQSEDRNSDNDYM